MFKIFFPFVENEYFHYHFKSLLDIILHELDYRLYTPRSSNLMDFLLGRYQGWEGPLGTPVYLDINGRKIINGSSVAVSSTLNFLLKLNNAFYYLLNGQEKAEVYVGKIYRKDETTGNKQKDFILNLELVLEDNELVVSFSEPVLEEIGYGKKSKYIDIKNERVNFYQAIEEVVEATKKYRETYLEAIQIISPKDVETVEKIYFSNNGKLDFSDAPWLSLEQAWFNYKKQHNITGADIKKIIAEEEKDKKMRKKWWKIF